MALTTDASTFTMAWAQMRGYANSPWSLIRRVLAQSQQQQAELVLLIASEPVWLAGYVYPACRNDILYCPQPALKCELADNVHGYNNRYPKLEFYNTA